MNRARQLSVGLVTHPLRSALCVLGVLLIATALITMYAAGRAEDDRRSQIDRDAAETAQAIERRMSAYDDALIALRGLFQIDPDPSRERFGRFARSLQLDTRSPGFRVVAYSRARQRRLTVEYMEPVAGNERAYGFDLLIDPIRAAAANRARATGRSVATAPVRLVQEPTEGRKAFVLMLAVRDRGRSPTSARTDRLHGMVTAAFDVAVLIDAILGGRSRDFDLEIYDAGLAGRPQTAKPSEGDLMFDSDGLPVLARGNGGGDGVSKTLEVGGRRWVVYYAPAGGSAALPGHNLPWIVAAGGTLISLLAGWLILTLARGGSRAQEIAERMTRDLAYSERHTRQILETAHDAFVAIDQHGCITDWNHRAEDTFGWKRGEVLGRDLAETIIPPTARDAHRAGLQRFMATGVPRATGRLLELTALHRGGWEFPVELTITPLHSEAGYVFNAFVRDVSERRTAAELADRQRRQLLEAQSIAELGSWEWDVTADRLEWSDELCRIFGLRPGSHPTSFDGYIDLVAPGDRELARTTVEAAYESGQSFTFNHAVLYRTGAQRIVHSRGEVVLGPGGEPVRMLGTAQDITERERIVAELRRSGRYFQLARDLICTVTPDGYFERINAAWTRTLGWTEEELLSRPFIELVHPEDRSQTMGETSAVVTMGKGDEFVNRYMTATGDWRWLEWTSMSEPEDGLIYAAARDITERKSAEERMQRNQALLADLLDSAPDAVIIADDNGRITLVNAQTEQLFGYQRGELVGEPIETLMPEQIRGRHVSHRAGYVAAPGTRPMGAGLDLFGRRKDGSEFPVDISLSAVDSEDGRLATAFVRDITERWKTENELAVAHERALEASRLKSEFVANMSHEIRTPLNGVIGLTGLLLDTDLSAEQREYVDAVGLSGDALMSVINDILDFSKIEAGKLELDRHIFDLRELVEGVSSILGTTAHDNRLELMTWVDPDLPASVYGDSARIRQVLTNLATNAVKFTTAGEVVIRVILEPGSAATLRFEVSDTGIGIHPTSLESIFDAFSQADSSTTRQFGGTGLGLAISKQLVDLMDGTIGVESELDTGSTFWFTIPLMVRRDGINGMAALDFGEVRALIVDDNSTNRKILEHQLGSWGIRCDTAADAPGAIDLMHASAKSGEPYALAVIDFNMPGANGVELAQRVRAIPSLSSTRLLMLTSSGAERALAEEAGVDALITKPVRQSRLAQEIAGLLGGAPEPEAANGSGPAELPRRPGAAPAETAAGRLILVVEDNPVNQLVATRMLERRGCRVEVAGNGREAIDLVGAEDYALVFMDCQMPVLDGYEATTIIRRGESGGRRLPIVAMTANTLKGDRERCLAAGMDDYLGKPLGPAELDTVLGRMLPGHAGEEQAPDPEFAATGGTDPGAVLVDPARLDDAFGSDHQARADLVAHFLTNARATIGDLASAIGGGDAEAAARLAHGLKGSAAVVGAERMSRIAARLCDVLTGGEVTDESTMLQSELERTFESTDKAFNRETNEAIT